MRLLRFAFFRRDVHRDGESTEVVIDGPTVILFVEKDDGFYSNTSIIL